MNGPWNPRIRALAAAPSISSILPDGVAIPFSNISAPAGLTLTANTIHVKPFFLPISFEAVKISTIGAYVVTGDGTSVFAVAIAENKIDTSGYSGPGKVVVQKTGIASGTAAAGAISSGSLAAPVSLFANRQYWLMVVSNGAPGLGKQASASTYDDCIGSGSGCSKNKYLYGAFTYGTVPDDLDVSAFNAEGVSANNFPLIMLGS